MTADQPATAADPRIPVTLLAGFLGSGKTTLLNRILSEQHGQRCAVIVNEFGDVPIDGQLVVGARDELVELANGCLCCTVRGDLLDTLAALVRGRKNRVLPATRFDRIVIEASGLASPGPAAATMHMPDLVGDLRMDGIVTLAHAGGIAEQIEKYPEAGEQLAFADLILLNHRDRCDSGELGRAEQAIRACNESAPLSVTERAAVDIASLFGLGDHGGGERSDHFASTTSSDAGEGHVPHTQGMASLTLESRWPLRMEELKYWIGFLGERRGQELMRAKGVLRCVDKQHPVVVQVVGRWFEIGEDARLEMPEISRLQLIGRHLDRAELDRGWEACVASGGAPA
jgi:G3E family GTPase